MTLPGLGMATGLVGAVFVAAAVALVVVNVVQIPTFGAGGSNEEETQSAQSPSSATLGSLTRIAAVEAKTEVKTEARPEVANSSPVPVPAGTLLAAVPTNEIAAPNPPAPTITQPPAALLPAPQPSPEVELVRPEIATPKAAPAPEPRPTVSLTRQEIAALLKRGQDLIAAGDIASARLILTHVAEAGDPEASFILAGTYDPAVLASRRTVGVQPDPAKARAWYTRAAEQGSSEARRRLDQSALR
jgi:TPR repeat protein